MKMGDGFAGVGTIINNEAKSTLIESEFFRNFTTRPEKMTEDRNLFVAAEGDTDNRFFRDDEKMSRGLRIDIVDGDTEIILVKNLSRNLSGDDAFKECHKLFRGDDEFDLLIGSFANTGNGKEFDLFVNIFTGTFPATCSLKHF